MLVFFHERGVTPPAEGEEFNPSTVFLSRITDLEDDLVSARELLQVASDDRRTAYEEVQAANEELLAGNEELQSSNEELESVNEELTTLNTEYQQKISNRTRGFRASGFHTGSAGHCTPQAYFIERTVLTELQGTIVDCSRYLKAIVRYRFRR